MKATTLASWVRSLRRSSALGPLELLSRRDEIEEATHRLQVCDGLLEDEDLACLRPLGGGRCAAVPPFRPSQPAPLEPRPARSLTPRGTCTLSSLLARLRRVVAPRRAARPAAPAEHLDALADLAAHPCAQEEAADVDGEDEEREDGDDGPLDGVGAACRKKRKRVRKVRRGGRSDPSEGKEGNAHASGVSCRDERLGRRLECEQVEQRRRPAGERCFEREERGAQVEVTVEGADAVDSRDDGDDLLTSTRSQG